jgi:hypothetical protein
MIENIDDHYVEISQHRLLLHSVAMRNGVIFRYIRKHQTLPPIPAVETGL